VAPSTATESIKRAGQVAWALVGLAAALAVVGWVAWKVRVIFPPMILAAAIVFLLNPVVTFLQRKHLPRLVGTGVTYVGLAGVAVLIGFLVAPAVGEQAQELSERWPELREKVQGWIDDRAESLEGTPFAFDPDRLIEGLTTSDLTVREQIDRAAEVGVQVFHVVLVLVLAPILAFYLLVDLPRVRRTAEGLIPEAMRDEVLTVAHWINRAVGGFFQGQLAVAMIVGVMASIGLWIIGLPFWLIVGLIAGFFNMIPLIGPYIGAVPGIVIALTTRDPLTALWVAVVMVVVQQIDNHFISPVVMHRAVKLHPAAVMLALLLGGTLGGFLGLLVAVPTAAVLKILAGHVWRVHVLGEPFAAWKAREEASGLAEGVGMVRRVGDGRDRGGRDDAGRDRDGRDQEEEDREGAEQPGVTPAGT
jgi:predicted PurR-regulated permease PerM